MYLCDYYASPQAGTEGQLLQLINNLDRSRYDPKMTVFRNSKYIENNAFPCSIEVLNITKLASVRSIFIIMRYALNLRRKGYKIVHCFLNDSSIIAPFFLKILGIRVLVSRRDMGFWYTPKNLIILRLVSFFIDYYVANSCAVKKVVQHKEWVPDKKVLVIYNGYKTSDGAGEKLAVAEIIGIPKNVPVIGLVANLRPIKRIDTLVKAFAIVSKGYPDVYLAIVGDKSSREAIATLRELEKLIHQLGIKNRVVFTGRVEKPMSYIRRFDIAVLCSESEGFSNSIVEYMWAARPIICTNSGGNSEIVQNDINGFLIPVGDFEALANRIIQLLSDSNLARRLGRGGYELAQVYSCSHMVERQMDCYDQVLTPNR